VGKAFHCWRVEENFPKVRRHANEALGEANTFELGSSVWATWTR